MDVDQHRAGGLERRFEITLQRVPLADVKAIHTEGKDIGRSVCLAASECNADLVVIASQDRRPLVARGLVDLDKLLGGSVSDYIRVHAPAPVLLVREPEQG